MNFGFAIPVDPSYCQPIYGKLSPGLNESAFTTISGFFERFSRSKRMHVNPTETLLFLSFCHERARTRMTPITHCKYSINVLILDVAHS